MRGNGRLLMLMGLGVVGSQHGSAPLTTLQDTTPVARLIEEPAIIVVTRDSRYRELGDLLSAWRDPPEAVPVGGGSAAGGPDHLAPMLVADAVGIPPAEVSYRRYDGGGALDRYGPRGPGAGRPRRAIVAIRASRQIAGYSHRMRTPQQILAESPVIAVVGASRDPLKAAHRVPLQMRRHGWRVIPVSPTGGELFGERVYPTLGDIPHPVDLVDVFRPAEEAPEVVRAAVAIGASAVWLQLGITSPEARKIAIEAGIDYVEDHCLAVERAAGGLSRLT